MCSHVLGELSGKLKGKTYANQQPSTGSDSCEGSETREYELIEFMNPVGQVSTVRSAQPLELG